MGDVFPRRNLGNAEYWGRVVENRLDAISKQKGASHYSIQGSNRSNVAATAELARNIEAVKSQIAQTQALLDSTPATGSAGSYASNFSLAPGWQTVLYTTIPEVPGRPNIDIFATAVVRVVDPGSGGGSSGAFRWPFPTSTVTSEYGPRDGRMHQGIDFGVPEGTPIPASNAGTVTGNGFGSGTGWYVDITHPGNIRTRYFHMVAQSDVAIGTVVSKSQVIGFVGNTGNSFGAHLHWETIVNGTHWNPRDFMAVYGDGGSGGGGGTTTFARPKARMFLNGVISPIEFSPHRNLVGPSTASTTLNQIFPQHQVTIGGDVINAEVQVFSETNVPANEGNFVRMAVYGVFRP